MSEHFPFLDELVRMYCGCNVGLFDGRLPVPNHILQLGRKVVFRFDPKSNYMEIGSKFPSVPVDELTDHYLHEMVHVANAVAKIRDCTLNQYHNKEFADTALSIGMCVGKHQSQGWSLAMAYPAVGINTTWLSPDRIRSSNLEKVVSAIKINWLLLKVGQKQVAELLYSTKPPKACFLKWVCKCPPPHNSIRTGRRPDSQHAPQIRCEICGAKFICVEQP